MAKQTGGPAGKKPPAYKRHKAIGQGRVRINGKSHYLGEYNSRASLERYEDLVNEWRTTQGDVSKYTLTIDELCLLFMGV